MRLAFALFLLSLAGSAIAQPYYRPPPDYDDPYDRPPPPPPAYGYYHHRPPPPPYGDPYDRPPPPPPVVCAVRGPAMEPIFCPTQQGPVGTSCHCRPNPFQGLKEYARSPGDRY
jgi:hypothetical protein